jgi:Glyoxalase-like domain
METLYEIDHVFVCAAFGAPEAEQLIAFGLTEGSRNRHPGQGTANRRFFFRNAMLELLWVESAEEAQGDNVRRLGLWERWS